MLLIVEGQLREFLPIKIFRAEAGLPPEFGIGLFITKDYTGLGCIHHAGAELQKVRTTMLEAVPQQPPREGWLTSALALQILFRKTLYAVNDKIGLQPSEIDFAATGFGEVCQAFISAMLRAQLERHAPPNFSEIYQRWLSSTVAISQASYFHRHQENPWRIQLVRTAYGRCGLIIHTDLETHYVHDPEHSCPAESFMSSLLSDVAHWYAVAVQQANPTHA
jgi:hypothetical protein